MRRRPTLARRNGGYAGVFPVAANRTRHRNPGPCREIYRAEPPRPKGTTGGDENTKGPPQRRGSEPRSAASRNRSTDALIRQGCGPNEVRKARIRRAAMAGRRQPEGRPPSRAMDGEAQGRTPAATAARTAALEQNKHSPFRRMRRDRKTRVGARTRSYDQFRRASVAF